MSGYLLAVLGIVGGLFAVAIGDMVSEEVRDRLDHLPHAILRLAAHRINATARAAIYDGEWLPELTYILQGDEARPVTRLYHGTSFALGIFVAARRIARDLHRAEPLVESQSCSFEAVERTEELEFDDKEDSMGPGPMVQRLVLGGHLRRLREQAGMTTERAAVSIRGSHSKISRMERGHVGFKERDIVDLLALYGVGEGAEREALLGLVREANTPGWWQAYTDILPNWVEPFFGLEAGASFIRQFELQFVPGLLQTEDYARAVIRLGNLPSEDEVIRRAQARVSRQDLLRRDDPPKLWAVLDEGALRRVIGGRQVMKAQLLHLIEMCDDPNVTLQILPFSVGAHRAMGGPVTILSYTEPDLRDVVYIEQLTSALYLDKPTEVDAYLEVIEEVCLQADPSVKTPGTLKSVLDNL
jgi:transcriptional regulator with XRE-family HTH domain